MKLVESAVKNYQFTLIMFVMVVVLGITTIMNMPRSEDPELSSPQFPVIVVYPGASPKDMEELIADPLEAKLSSLENVKKISTLIRDGVAEVDVIFVHGSDVNEKYQEVIREVSAMRRDLPEDIYSIEIIKWLPSNVNVLQVALISETAPYSQMKTVADDLKDELEKLTELKNVEISGIPDKIVKVVAHTDRMKNMHVPLDAVIGALQSESVNIPGGRIEAGLRTYNIKTSGKYSTIDEIKNTVLYSVQGRNILLRDVADITFEYERGNHLTRLNGHRSVFVNAAQKPDENISETQQKYKEVIEQYKSRLPGNIDMVHHFDQAEDVNRRLGGLGIDFLIAIGLVAFTLLPLGYRAAMIVMISIPLSLSIGIVLVDLLGYNLNQLSIVGLVVALGLLVDDSIVVIENIERWVREGHSRLEASIKATKQIALAVVGCTATLVIAFLPLVFLPESSGDFIRSLPVAVIMTVLASMVVSLTIMPLFASRLLKEHAGHPDGNIFLRSLKKVIHGSYAVLLEKALRNPWKTVAVTVIVFGASLMLMPVIGFSLFPASEKPQFMIEVTTPPQSSLSYTDSVSRIIERELSSHPEVRFYATNVGKGNPQIYYNVFQGEEKTDFAQFFVQLHPVTKNSRKLEILQELRKKYDGFPGAKIEVINFEQGPPIVAPIDVRVMGDNLDTLRKLSFMVEEMLRSTEGTMYIDNPLSHLKSDIKIDIDQEKAQSLGIPTIAIDRTVRMAIAGLDAGKMTDSEGENYPIRVTTAGRKVATLDDLDNLFITGMQGNAIPLSQIATLTFESSPVQINHLNKARKVSVSAFVSQGYLSDNIVAEMKTKLSEVNLPPGYSFGFGGEYESRQESFGGFGSVIIVTIFLFIAVLILEFKTFKSTLIVLSVVPLGMVGALLSLWITGNSLSFVAIIGLIALAGVEVKNTILLVDFTNQLREKGMELNAAIKEAGEVRFLPIILTSLTAIGGLLPIAVSTNPLISPLAIVMIGGLISSTLLSRIVTPVVYRLIPPKIDVVKVNFVETQIESQL